MLGLAHSRLYWIAMIALGLVLESVALLYQYVLDYPPCLLCIHVRIWVMVFVLVAIAALVLRRYKHTYTVCHLLTTAVMVGGLERSWFLLGIERGTAVGGCGPYASLPAWLPLDNWFPWMFAIWEGCGKTPVMPLNVTMAEVLVVMFAILLLISGALLVTSIRAQLAKPHS